MRILFTSTSLVMGGAERQICDLADQFFEIGHEVKIISMNKEIISTPKNEIEIIDLKMQKTPLGMIKAFYRCSMIIKAFKPDVVHSHMVHANIFVRILRMFTPMKKLVCTAHSTNEGGSLRMFLYRITDSLANVTTNVSNEAVDAFIEKKASKRDRIIPMYNGIDTNRFTSSDELRKSKRLELKIKDDEQLILAVGRLNDQKDYPNLLAAFKSIETENCKLAIVGSGELENDLIVLTKKLEIDNNVTFLGLRNDVNELMCASDVFALSSKEEGFGLVIAEAMLCERVVVATDCGGVSEVLDGNGFLVEPCNSNQLSEALKQALTLPNNEKQRIGINARQHILNNFDIKEIAEQWLSIYKK